MRPVPWPTHPQYSPHGLHRPLCITPLKATLDSHGLIQRPAQSGLLLLGDGWTFGLAWLAWLPIHPHPHPIVADSSPGQYIGWLSAHLLPSFFLSSYTPFLASACACLLAFLALLGKSFDFIYLPYSTIRRDSAPFNLCFFSTIYNTALSQAASKQLQTSIVPPLPPLKIPS